MIFLLFFEGMQIQGNSKPLLVYIFFWMHYISS